MPRLKSRDRFIPNGFKFRQAETNWPPPGSNILQGASFDTVVRLVQRHRQGNPFHAKKNNWALDYASIADEIDAYNAAICASMGWNDYILQGGAPQPVGPFSRALGSLANSARHVVVGASTIAEMFGADGPVGAALANGRATVCVDCPKNFKGDWTRIFTVPAAAAVRKMLETFNGLNLRVQQEDELQVCEACGCPMKLKVWAQLNHILEHMPEADYYSLDPRCWITKERNASIQNQRGPGEPGDSASETPKPDGTDLAPTSEAMLATPHG